jgi:hypothetical protein
MSLKTFVASGLLLTTTPLFISSCSTVFNGSRQDVSITSTPSDADIYVDGEKVGAGHVELRLKRGKDHVVEVKKAGYNTAKISTDKTLTGWFWGNLLCGGVVGFAVDLITGSAFDVDPDKIVVSLDKGTGAIEKKLDSEFGTIEVQNASGQSLAKVEINWE